MVRSLAEVAGRRPAAGEISHFLACSWDPELTALSLVQACAPLFHWNVLRKGEESGKTPVGTCQVLDQRTGDSAPFSPCKTALVENDYKQMKNSETQSRSYAVDQHGAPSGPAGLTRPQFVVSSMVQWFCLHPRISTWWRHFQHSC